MYCYEVLGEANVYSHKGSQFVVMEEITSDEIIINAHNNAECPPSHSSDFDSLLTLFRTMGVY